MATKLKVAYNDGRKVEILASPRAQVMTERHFKGINDATSVEASYYLAWASLHYAGKEPAEFDAWLDLVSEATVEEPKGDEADPTKTGQSPTGSSD